ncbi:hypothetical protein GCM10023078_08130 [Gibbsiella greigii]
MQGVNCQPASTCQASRPAMGAEGALRIEFRHSVADIDAQDWDRLCQPHQFCRHDYMTALEASGLDCRFLYALAITPAGLAGIGIATQWSIAMPCRLSLSTTTLGTPVNTGLPLMIAPWAEPAAVSQKLVQALAAQSGKQGSRLFIGRDFPEARFLGPTRLDRLYACAHLDLAWPDFETYLAGQPKRKSLRRDIRSLGKAGYELEIRKGQRLSEEEALRLHALWLQLYKKYQSPDQIMVTKAFFLEMSRLEHAVWLLLRKDGRIDAFDMCFTLGDTLESTYCGVDFEQTGRLSVHRVMGYEIVRYALEQGLRSINFGISNEQSKVDMGCRLETCYAWFKANPSWLGFLFRPLIFKFVLENEEVTPHETQKKISAPEACQ